jgi:N-glycosylase/DNA lyase
MSKALYDEVQEFLLDKWGPMGGWAQAVMFALELPDATVSKGAKGAGSTPKKTPKKGTVMSEFGTPIKAEEGEDLVKLEEAGEGSAQAWRTPVKEPGMGLDSPVPTPTRSRNGSTSKRKLATPKRAATMGDQVKMEEGEGEVFTPGGLPAGYGFKRTRSAARIELQRKESGVSVLAEEVKDLGGWTDEHSQSSSIVQKGMACSMHHPGER